MPRLFTGLEIPQTQRTFLSFLQSGLKNARWIEPFDLHITLRFIGDVSPKVADDVVDTLSSCNWKAPQIGFDGLDVFGGAKPRTVFAAISANQALSNLVARQEILLQRIGIPAEHRKFMPHVTIARLRPDTGAQPVADYLTRHGGFKAPGFRPARFVLYSARESTGGGPYAIEVSWPFDLDTTLGSH